LFEEPRPEQVLIQLPMFLCAFAPLRELSFFKLISRRDAKAQSFFISAAPRPNTLLESLIALNNILSSSRPTSRSSRLCVLFAFPARDHRKSQQKTLLRKIAQNDSIAAPGLSR
jgi:hypothetical protein